MTKIAVTGANGFVGQALCQELQKRSVSFVPAVRRSMRADHVAVGTFDETTDWAAVLTGCSSVIHLAARVHVMQEVDANPLEAFRKVNVAATLNLAKQAVALGIRRFVYVSSIKVNGEATNGVPFSAHDQPAPVGPYAISKHEAEEALKDFCASSGMELVIVRPPLVYGSGVGANFRSLIRLVKLGIPLPLGSVENRRSMVAVENLVDLLILCTSHPNASGQTFLVSDDNDLSTPQLVRLIADGLKANRLIFRFPPKFLSALAGVVGKAGAAERLIESLQVDISHTKSRLEWIPLASPRSAIERTVAEFITKKAGKV